MGEESELFGRYPWLASDMVKFALIVGLQCHNVLQLLSFDQNIAKRRIQWVNFGVQTLASVTFLGFHEPLHFGWQWFVASQGILLMMLLANATYITYIVVKASYRTARLSTDFPPSIGKYFYGSCVFTETIYIAMVQNCHIGLTGIALM
mmetsp:Transcript_27074/g.43533  ORF Transcript_27074/g.43533 Transcript_27074/m.43533 type:complete len:149 (+) Transcript_27074:77-523(+)